MREVSVPAAWLEDWNDPAQRLRPREFEQITRLAREKFGLDLRRGKEQLVIARLGKVLRAGGFDSFEQYHRHVLEDRTGQALTDLIDALTTNHTSFLREPVHFSFLRSAIARQVRSGGRLELWSAGCSTGEEPYSIAFSIIEELGFEALGRVRILATDISSRVLKQASAGVYGADRIGDLPLAWHSKYFLKGGREWEGSYRVKREIRSLIKFRRLNLIEPEFQPGLFHYIFCRNVMIYFDKPTQEAVVCRLTQHLEAGGHLLIGHAESFGGIRHSLRYVAPATYRKPSREE